MEMSHRNPEFDAVINGPRRTHRLYSIPDDYDVMFMQGGASPQFAMIPLNIAFGGHIAPEHGPHARSRKRRPSLTPMKSGAVRRRLQPCSRPRLNGNNHDYPYCTTQAITPSGTQWQKPLYWFAVFAICRAILSRDPSISRTDNLCGREKCRALRCYRRHHEKFPKFAATNAQNYALCHPSRRGRCTIRQHIRHLGHKAWPNGLSLKADSPKSMRSIEQRPKHCTM